VVFHELVWFPHNLLTICYTSYSGDTVLTEMFYMPHYLVDHLYISDIDSKTIRLTEVISLGGVPFCKSYFPDDGKMAHDIARERERTKNLSIRFHML
jgi:hypothetical protein